MAKAFDPHYHTIYSDGWSKILESIEAAQRKNLAALIITDHFNNFGYNKSYKQNRKMLNLLRPKPAENTYPVIIGMELGVPERIRLRRDGGKEEVLVFGTEFCETIQENIAEINKYDIQEFKKLKQKYENNCAIVQCHPFKEARGVDRKLLPILDGCEITKRGNLHYNHEAIRKDCEKKGITPLASSDGHVAYRDPNLVYEVETPLGKAYTIASIDITCEKDLIKVIKENLIKDLVYNKYRNF